MFWRFKIGRRSRRHAFIDKPIKQRGLLYWGVFWWPSRGPYDLEISNSAAGGTCMADHHSASKAQHRITQTHYLVYDGYRLSAKKIQRIRPSRYYRAIERAYAQSIPARIKIR